MAKEAERLLEGSGWLPEPLRLIGAEVSTIAEIDAQSLPEFLTGDGEASTEDADGVQPEAIAAE